MCSCHSILECCVTFSGVKLSIRSFVLFATQVSTGATYFWSNKIIVTYSIVDRLWLKCGSHDATCFLRLFVLLYGLQSNNS